MAHGHGSVCGNCPRFVQDATGACSSLNRLDCVCSLCGELDPHRGATDGCPDCRRVLQEEALEAEIAAGWDDSP
jgi:hypothetical protein